MDPPIALALGFLGFVGVALPVILVLLAGSLQPALHIATLVVFSRELMGLANPPLCRYIVRKDMPLLASLRPAFARGDVATMGTLLGPALIGAFVVESAPVLRWIFWVYDVVPLYILALLLGTPEGRRSLLQAVRPQTWGEYVREWLDYLVRHGMRLVTFDPVTETANALVFAVAESCADVNLHVLQPLRVALAIVFPFTSLIGEAATAESWVEVVVAFLSLVVLASLCLVALLAANSHAAPPAPPTRPPGQARTPAEPTSARDSHADLLRPAPTWTVSTVVEWLELVELGALAPVIQRHRIDGQRLLRLTTVQMVEMGMDDPNARNNLKVRREQIPRLQAALRANA